MKTVPLPNPAPGQLPALHWVIPEKPITVKLQPMQAVMVHWLVMQFLASVDPDLPDAPAGVQSMWDLVDSIDDVFSGKLHFTSDPVQ